MNAAWKNGAKKLWPSVILTLLLMSLTIWGCSDRIVYHGGNGVAVVDANEPAPFNGVLLGFDRYNGILNRLQECEP